MPERPATPSSWSDARIVAALAALRDDMLVPDAPLDVTIVGTLTAAPANVSRWRRPALVAAVVVLVSLVLTLAVAPARDAVADWLGIGSTEVRIDPGRGAPDGSLPAIDDGARAVDADGAARALGRELPPLAHPATDAPAQFALPVEGGVLVRWPGRDETLWMHEAVMAPSDYRRKFATDEADVRAVDDLGEDALWVGGAHLLETPARAVAARNVLLWLDERAGAPLELRLEGDLDRDEIVALAHALGFD
jgi:hypothetical protein